MYYALQLAEDLDEVLGISLNGVLFAKHTAAPVRPSPRFHTLVAPEPKIRGARDDTLDAVIGDLLKPIENVGVDDLNAQFALSVWGASSPLTYVTSHPLMPFTPSTS